MAQGFPPLPRLRRVTPKLARIKRATADSPAVDHNHPVLIRYAAWALLVAFVMSLAYELYRATVRRGTSRHDSMPLFLQQGIGLYVIAGIVVYALFAGYEWAATAGLALSVGMIVVSIFYYNPKIMLDRRPGLIDWIEDLVFTGLLFVAATLLAFELCGLTLVARP